MLPTVDRYLRITAQQLRCFEATARLLSVTRAAQELHVTQPTVSVQLRELAQAIGEPLLEVQGRRLRLTQPGEALQQTLGELRGCWERFHSRLGEIHGLMRGRLRIAAVTTAEYFVPDLLGPFAHAHPGVDIELVVENRDRVVERLSRGGDDLAVMMVPPQDLPLESVPFVDNPLVIIAAAAHPLAGRRIRLSSLAGERWLMREAGSGTRMAAEQHFVHAGFEPRVAMSLGSNEAIKHAVTAGLRDLAPGGAIGTRPCAGQAAPGGTAGGRLPAAPALAGGLAQGPAAHRRRTAVRGLPAAQRGCRMTALARKGERLTRVPVRPAVRCDPPRPRVPGSAGRAARTPRPGLP